jgi:predicted nucleotidyltransferase
MWLSFRSEFLYLYLAMISKEQIKSIAVSIFKNNGVVRAALFGSIVRGDRTAQSDIDILVELEEGKTLLDLIGLQLELEEQLGARVDVVTYDSLHPMLREMIMHEQEPIYETATADIH